VLNFPRNAEAPVADDSTTYLQAWIDRMNGGDAAARDQLIGHACARLRRLTRQQLRLFPGVRPFEETDDVLGNTVVRLMRRLEAVTVPDVAEFFRLAVREIRRELLDLARRHRRTPQTAAPASDPAGSSSGPEALARWTEFHERAAALPAAERDVFEHLWYLELTQEQTARSLGLNRSAVQRLWLSARLRLQKVLHGQPFGD
jgi:RNA polymerase sigma-70 factor (ECF subfamily)